METISIIGSGVMASAVGHLAVKAGHTVEVITRDAAKSQALVSDLGKGAKTGEYGSAPLGEIVILAVPYSAALAVIKHFGEALSGKILLDITNPVNPSFTGFVTPTGSSGAEEIRKASPKNITVIKAFNTQFSEVLATGSSATHSVDVLLAGDDAATKARVSKFTSSLGLRPFDAGALSTARLLEHVCLLSLGLMANAFKHTKFSIGISLLK